MSKLPDLNARDLWPDMSHMDHSSHFENVYEPAEDTWLLVDTLSSPQEREYLRGQLAAAESSGRRLVCMEMGSGSGYVLTYLHNLLMWIDKSRSGSCGSSNEGEEQQRPKSHMFIASDINEHAALATARTLEHNGVKWWDVVRMSFADGFMKRFQSHGEEENRSMAVDILLFNPPYVPTPPEELGRDDIYAAWAGGERGREVVDQVLPHVQYILQQSGVFYLIALEENDPQEIMDIMSREDYGGFKSRIIAGHRKGGEDLHVIKFWREEEEDAVDRDESKSG